MGLSVCPTCGKSVVTSAGNDQFMCPRDTTVIPQTKGQVAKPQFGQDTYPTFHGRQRG